MKSRTPAALTASALVLVVCGGSAAAATIVIDAVKAGFTSGFFFGAPALRGNEASSASSVLGVSSFPYGPQSDAAGLAPEVTYFGFDSAALAAIPSVGVVRITLEAQTVFRDFMLPLPSADNPVSISARGVSADPFTFITSSTTRNAFYTEKLLSPAGSTTLTGEGVYAWDVTSLVSGWIAGGSAVPVIAMTGAPDSNFIHGFRNPRAAVPVPGINPRLVFEIIPEPGTTALLVLVAAGLGTRRRRASSTVSFSTNATQHTP